jgi:hypothetical protein
VIGPSKAANTFKSRGRCSLSRKKSEEQEKCNDSWRRCDGGVGSDEQQLIARRRSGSDCACCRACGIARLVCVVSRTSTSEDPQRHRASQEIARVARAASPRPPPLRVDGAVTWYRGFRRGRISPLPDVEELRRGNGGVGSEQCRQ